MGDRITRDAPRLFVALHSAAWLAMVMVWVSSWQSFPDPSGPQFNFAMRFLGRIDVLVDEAVFALSTWTAQIVASWGVADLGLSFAVAFAALMLLGGTLQWLLAGKLIQYVFHRFGKMAALILSGLGVMWFAGALVSWLIL